MSGRTAQTVVTALPADPADLIVDEDVAIGAGAELARGAVERCPDLRGLDEGRLASALEAACDAARMLLAHARSPLHFRAPRPRQEADMLADLRRDADRSREALRTGRRPRPEYGEEHAGGVLHRLAFNASAPLLPDPVEVGLAEAWSPLYALDPCRRAESPDTDDEAATGRALAVGLQRLRTEARAGLATFHALCVAGELSRIDVAWLLRATGARAHLVRSRALAAVEQVDEELYAG